MAENGESKMFGVSIRGWLAVLVMFTVCVMSIIKNEIKEPLYTLSVAIMSFYFAQSKKQGPTP